VKSTTGGLNLSISLAVPCLEHNNTGACLNTLLPAWMLLDAPSSRAMQTILLGPSIFLSALNDAMTAIGVTTLPT
jgi:hypothetical protein